MVPRLDQGRLVQLVGPHQCGRDQCHAEGLESWREDVLVLDYTGYVRDAEFVRKYAEFAYFEGHGDADDAV